MSPDSRFPSTGLAVSASPEWRCFYTGKLRYPKERFEAACRIALGMSSSPRYRLIQSILINNQDIVRKEQETQPKENGQVAEDNGAFIRGASYYGGGDHNA